MFSDTPIITSLLDDDKYNFHMGNFFFHNYRHSHVSYTYKCRDENIDFAPIFNDLNKQISHLRTLKLTTDEAHYMAKNSFCSEEYLDFLVKNPPLKELGTYIRLDNEGNLKLRYSDNPALAIYAEIKILAIISELYFRNLYKNNYQQVLDATDQWVQEQINWLNTNAHPNLKFTEAGGRRRFSKDRHEQITVALWNGTRQYMAGTSNCLIGMKHNIPTVGTQAHQLYMFMQTVTHPALSQVKALKEWYEFYGDNLNIALTDTLGNEKWDKDFNQEFRIKYKGQRHDSGNPYHWADYRLVRYKDAGIDPKTKTFVFGDSLDWEKANHLTKTYSDQINVSHLIGTFITNTLGEQFPNHKPLSQVIKMTWANELPTCKLSADIVKAQCEDAEYLNFMKKIAKDY
jgi:nicotinate phosphoribosyltransferase